MTWLARHTPELSDYEEEPCPFVCPRCGSREIDYLQDAGARWHQRMIGEQAVRTQYALNLYDTILEVECRGCGHRDEHPGRTEWG